MLAKHGSEVTAEKLLCSNCSHVSINAQSRVLKSCDSIVVTSFQDPYHYYPKILGSIHLSPTKASFSRARQFVPHSFLGRRGRDELIHDNLV